MKTASSPTGRERVRAALSHQVLDRPPYFIDLCRDMWEIVQASGIANGLSLDAFIDNDIADVPPPWWTYGDLAPDWKEPDPPTSLPVVTAFGSYDGLADRAKELRKTGKYLISRIYGVHFERAYFARGFENFLADMAGNPEFAKELLDDIIRRNLVMLDNILSIPEVDGVLFGSDWGTQRGPLMSLAVWKELIMEGERKMYNRARAYGKDIWIHSCGNIVPFIPSLVEMGVSVLNPVQPEAMDIGELKRDFGRDLTFWGGLSTQQTLPFGTPDELRREARRTREILGSDGGYVFSPAQSVQSDVPLDNLLALLEVARETA